MSDRVTGTRGRRDGEDGIVDLLRETMDGLGRLIGDHIKLAKLELVADARQVGRRASMVLVAVPVLMLGYAILCLAAAAAIGRLIGLPLGLLVVGGFHLVVGGVLLLVGLSRGRHRARLMEETTAEVGRTVAAIKAQASGPSRFPADG